MIRNILVDAGPLVALLNPRDQWHEWARSRFDEMVPPLITCEAVISEACFLARRTSRGASRVLGLVERNVVALGFSLNEHYGAVAALMRRYEDIPMSLADACLVRLTELVGGRVVFTLDSDFHVYRRNGRQSIPLVIPPSR